MWKIPNVECRYLTTKEENAPQLVQVIRAGCVQQGGFNPHHALQAIVL